MNRYIWFLKQLLPLIYVSEELIPDKKEIGVFEKQLCIWQMWFGKCYNIKRYTVIDE